MKKLFLFFVLLLLNACLGKDQYETKGYESKHLIDVYYSTDDIRVSSGGGAIRIIAENFDNACFSKEFAEFVNIAQNENRQNQFLDLASRNNDNYEWNVSFLSLVNSPVKQEDVACNRALAKGIAKIELESSADFDADHPAGTSLMDIASLEICSFGKVLGDGSNAGYILALRKPYSSYSREELAVVGYYFYLTFDKAPKHTATHNLTLTITFDDGSEFSDTVEVKF